MKFEIRLGILLNVKTIFNANGLKKGFRHLGFNHLEDFSMVLLIISTSLNPRKY